MRKLLDRLLVALVPYAGVLTVSTCGGVPDCEESGDHKTVTMTATVSGDADLATTPDGPIVAPLVKSEAAGSEPSWRCEARVIGRGSRETSDTSVIAVPANATVFCAIGDGSVTKRVWTFDVPTGDLRSTPASTTASMRVSLQDYAAPSASCSATIPVTLEFAAGEVVGDRAPPPEHVTADFVRSVTTTVRVDDTTTSTATDRACAHRLAGTFRIVIRFDASSFVEADTPTCL